MRGKDVAQFACELKEALEGQGALALERINWADRFWEFGFYMDAGDSLERHYCLSLHDVRGLRRELSRIDDIQTLGDAVFSECRYIKHWAMGPYERELDWLVIALGRLEEFTRGV